MFEIAQLIALFMAGAIATIFGVLLGAWLVFKVNRAAPGEKFIGGVPSGQVFSIPDLEEEEPMDKSIVMDRLNQFMGQFKEGK
jgi:hypothetical protein